MKEITDLLKCPGCYRKGTMQIIIRKKQAEAQCQVCDEIVTSRVPYPKHRTDHEGYQYHFEIPSAVLCGPVRKINIPVHRKSSKKRIKLEVRFTGGSARRTRQSDG